MRRLIAAFLCLAAPLAAETPLDAEAFAERVEGRTLTFVVEGRPYGIERYMDGQRVIWSFLDGDCALGEWYQQDEAICFVYDHSPEDPQCWRVFDEGAALRAEFLGTGGQVLYEARPGDEELICENFGS